jgi:hypothetical protein
LNLEYKNVAHENFHNIGHLLYDVKDVGDDGEYKTCMKEAVDRVDSRLAAVPGLAALILLVDCDETYMKQTIKSESVEETHLLKFEEDDYVKRDYLIDGIVAKYEKDGFDVKCFICTYSGICEGYFNSHRRVFSANIDGVLTLNQGNVSYPLEVAAGEVLPKDRRELKLDLFEKHEPGNAYTRMDFQRRKITRALGRDYPLSNSMMLLIDDGPQNELATVDNVNKAMIRFRKDGVVARPYVPEEVEDGGLKDPDAEPVYAAL